LFTMLQKNISVQGAITKKNPYDKKSILHYNQMRRWFLSEYFHRLTNLDGKAILERLDAE